MDCYYSFLSQVDPILDDIIMYGKVRLEKLRQFRVVVVTLSTAGRLVSAGISVGHFTHVFVDEAGQATEPESLIPLAGLMRAQGCLVLSGDPNQLGPVNQSQLAKKHGLDTSLLERLMTGCDMYKKDREGNRQERKIFTYIVFLLLLDVVCNCHFLFRNPRVITKLLKNFRSHADLLSLPSRLFYDNELQACKKDRGGLESLSHLPWVPSKGFPLIFHGVVNRHGRTNTTTSLFNEMEVSVVVDYVSKLMATGVEQTSVGIVSPYRRQVRMIREKLQVNHIIYLPVSVPSFGKLIAVPFWFSFL